jgi:tRNA (guanine26-N2/guanine27-N2)-dimethyltransferase
VIPAGYEKVTEGTTDLLVPEGFCRKGPGARRGEVFYNRQMEFGRDVSVMFGRASFGEGHRILDGLAASGARGLRLANECGVKAAFTLNDRNLASAVLMKQNADLNHLYDVEILCRDLRGLLSDDRFDYIDIDPFGTPVEFVDSAVQSCRRGGTLAVTATDTAPLYGTYPKTCLRRYGALSARSPFAHETGLRILVGFMVREAAKHDRACEPLLCYHADHYFRCYLRVEDGASKADASLKKMGFARYDRKSLERGVSSDRTDDKDAGPLWTGPLLSKKLLRSMKATNDLGTVRRCEKALEVWREEAGAPPLYYVVDELAQRTKKQPPKISDLVSRIVAEGAKGSRTHFDPKGVKTDLGARELQKIFKEPRAGP